MSAIQSRVVNTGIDTFGAENMRNLRERSMRFLEEAVELVAAAGLYRHEIDAVVNNAWKKPVGDTAQELGGAGCTLMSLAEVLGYDLITCVIAETDRVGRNKEFHREKHAAKEAAVKAA